MIYQNCPLLYIVTQCIYKLVNYNNTKSNNVCKFYCLLHAVVLQSNTQMRLDKVLLMCLLTHKIVNFHTYCYCTDLVSPFLSCFNACCVNDACRSLGIGRLYCTVKHCINDDNELVYSKYDM